MRTARMPALGAALALLFAGGLSGCAPSATSCVDWVGFGSSQALFDGATLVVAGTVGADRGSVDMLSGPGRLHEVAVDAVFKGGIDPETVRVAAPRDYCVANPPQPAEDPLVEGERVLLYLSPLVRDAVAGADPLPASEVEMWSTMTSHEGVEPFPEGSEVPFDVAG